MKDAPEQRIANSRVSAYSSTYPSSLGRLGMRRRDLLTGAVSSWTRDTAAQSQHRMRRPACNNRTKFPLLATFALMLLAACSTFIELAKSANAQELPVPCNAFYRNFLGQWIAAQPVSVPTRIGILGLGKSAIQLRRP